MTDVYLIAHKVRGEPAFDIAIRLECPLCAGHGHDLDGVCHECDGTGYWWIIPTSGHRAYPAEYWMLDELELDGYPHTTIWGLVSKAELPPDLPDHYITKEAPKVSLIDALGLTRPKPAPAPTIRRRI